MGKSSACWSTMCDTSAASRLEVWSKDEKHSSARWFLLEIWGSKNQDHNGCLFFCFFLSLARSVLLAGSSFFCLKGWRCIGRERIRSCYALKKTLAWSWLSKPSASLSAIFFLSLFLVPFDELSWLSFACILNGRYRCIIVFSSQSLRIAVLSWSLIIWKKNMQDLGFVPLGKIKEWNL